MCTLETGTIAFHFSNIFNYFLSSKNVTKLGYSIQNVGENEKGQIYAFSVINYQHYCVYLY